MTYQAPKVYAPYNYDPKALSDASAIAPSGLSLTVQSMADEADINNLMRHYGILGQMPANPRVPMYGDFSDVHDYQSALNSINQADQAFMEFPAELRAKFENNPQLLLDFVENPANLEEGRKLGIFKEKPNGTGSIDSQAAKANAPAGAAAPSGNAGAGNVVPGA